MGDPTREATRVRCALCAVTGERGPTTPEARVDAALALVVGLCKVNMGLDVPEDLLPEIRKVLAEGMGGDPTTAPRELAMWWAAWHAWTEQASGGMPPARRLDDAERERLFAWVRERAGKVDADTATRRVMHGSGLEYRDARALVDAARACDSCKGSGGWHDDDEGWRQCSSCKGAGAKPSAAGWPS
jgi:hypothetical protein